MARKRKRKSTKNPVVPVLLFIFAILIISGLLGLENTSTDLPNVSNIISEIFTSDTTLNNKISDVDTVSKNVTNNNIEDNDNSAVIEKKEQMTNGTITSLLKLHFIDVGQADSILLEQNGEFMLIDGGNKDDSSIVIEYLKKKGVEELKYVIATHIHEDHIGGLPAILKSFPTNNFYIGKRTATTNIYKNLVSTAKSLKLTFTEPKISTKLNLGGAEITVVAPNSSGYKDLNNDSIVLRVVYGNNSFLLTGDAEGESEVEMIKSGQNIKADLLKIGHHGSTSSTTSAFLKAVSPKYAIISVGKDNSYKHPSKSAMDRLKIASIPVYRTDESGTIVVTSDGINITFDKAPGSYNGK